MTDEPDFEPAQFSRNGDVTVARLTRLVDASVDDVWAFLTEPAKLAQWLAPGRLELRIGGEAKLNFADSGIVIDSTVTALQPGSVLEYGWNGPGEPLRPLHWELRPEGDAVRLNLTLTLPANEDAGRSAAGFDAHMLMLAAALAGVPIKFPFEAFKQARDQYRAQLAS